MTVHDSTSLIQEAKENGVATLEGSQLTTEEEEIVVDGGDANDVNLAVDVDIELQAEPEREPSLRSPLRTTPSGRWRLRDSDDDSELIDVQLGSIRMGVGPPPLVNQSSAPEASPDSICDISLSGSLDEEIIVPGGGEASALLQLNSSFASNMSQGGAQSVQSSHTGLMTKPETTPFQLYDDIYGLIYLAKSSHPAYYFALVVFSIQSLLLLLIFFDMVQVGVFESVDRGLNGVLNRMNMPPAVPITVTVAQMLGIMCTVLVVASEGDLTRGSSKLFDGYQTDLIQKDPDATYKTWLLAAWAQVFVGVLMTADCFILIMQSRTVIEMCLNFAALHFVQEIDDIAFAVAQRGYITASIQEECERVSENMTSTLPWLRTINLRRTLLVLITIALYVAFAVLLYWQWGGVYLCKTLHVQFGGSLEPDLDFYSGVFQSQGNFPANWIDSRTVYYDESGALQLSYCSSEKAWVFSKQTKEPCDHYFVLSSRAEVFDVLEVAGQGWSHRNMQTGELSPFEWLSISCVDCGEETSIDEVCNPEFGRCVDRKCECYDGRMGVNCEFAEPTCRYLYLDVESRGTLASVPSAFVFSDIEYAPLNLTNDTLLQLKNRPVYVPSEFHNNNDNNFAFIFFSGRRWILFGKQPEEHSTLSPHELIRKIQLLAAKSASVQALKNFSQLEPYKPLFFSSPVNHGTASDSVEPTNVDWVVSRIDGSLEVLEYRPNDKKPVNAQLLCSECNNSSNPCLNSGICDYSGVCGCLSSYHGPLCESAYTCEEVGCVHGGFCHPILHTCSQCPQGVYGTLCQYMDQVVDQGFCDQIACKNFGICDPILERCVCTEGFGGEYCDEEILEPAVGNLSAGSP